MSARRGSAADGEIRYEERGAVGYLHFDFYNGALSTAQCERLRAAYARARRRPTRVIVLMGGADFWCNGMHLHCIEAADSPADASWDNINGIDDLARDILMTDTHLTIAALQGNAAAGGVFLALAADSRAGAQRHRAQSALSQHGQSLRLGILDLPVAATRGRRAGAERSWRGVCRSARRKRARSD